MWLNLIVTILVLLSGVANLFLAFYVYRKNPEARVNKNFGYFGFTVFLWCIANFAYLVVQNLLWMRIIHATAIIMPVANIFFVCALVDKEINKQIRIFLLALGTALFSVSLFTPLFIKSITALSDVNSGINFGPLFSIYGASMILMTLVGLYIPLDAIRKVSGQKRNQILYFLTGLAMLAFWAIAVNIILPLLGYPQLNYTNTLATIFLVGFTSYAIIKYHLMDISSLLFQAFIYSLVIVLIVILLLLLTFVSFFFLENSLTWLLYAIVVLIAVVLFFIGRLFFIEKRDLEKAKINLTEMLERSEENRMRAEAERDKTATIVTSFSDGLIILDEKDKISSVNPEAEKILGLEKNRLLSKPFQSIASFPNTRPLEAVLKKGLLGIFRKEVELKKDFVLELSVIPLDLDNDDIGHLIVLHDISREKAVEKLKTEFVSLAAHQLRTPLSIIKWYLSMLKKGDFGKLTKKQVDAVGKTFINNERMVSLVNDLLDVARIEEGRYLYKVAAADIGEIVTLAINNYKSEIEHKKIKVSFKNPDDLPHLTLDTEKIKLAIQNFIDNAIKYSPEGGKIEITLRSDGRNVEFKIQDFGMGIPKDQKDRIFTKFFRGDNAVKINTVGTGLGLFLAKNIIEAHGGRTWLESEENVGTSFYFSLPIKKGVV